VMTLALYPTADQIRALLAEPDEQPVVMVNLLRFKEKADPPDDKLSGEEVYRRYADRMVTLVESKGGRLIWAGRIDAQMIGTGGDGFQVIGLLEYPSRRSFVDIAADPEFQAISPYRESGLEGQWLFASTTESPA